MTSPSEEYSPPSFEGTLRAVMAMPGSIIEAVVRKTRVKVGLVSCEFRLYEKQVIRCYHCYDYGHTRCNCTGTDRGNLWMTCREEDHKAKDYKTPSNCVLCKEKSRRANHYPRSGRCETRREGMK